MKIKWKLISGFFVVLGLNLLLHLLHLFDRELTFSEYSLFLILVILLSLFVVRVTVRSVLRPFNHLTSTTKRIIQEEDYSIRAHAETRDETHVLAEAINNMLEQIQHREKEMSESENRLRQVIDLVPHFIFAKDYSGTFLLANQAVAQYLGMSVEELVGKKLIDLWPVNENTERMLRDDREVIDSRQRKKFPEEHSWDSEGKLHVYQVHKIPFTIDGKQTALGVSVEITELKLIQSTFREINEVLERKNQELHRERRMLNGIIDNIPDAIFVKDLQHRFVVANQALATGMGLQSPDSLIGKTDFEFFDSKEAQEFQEIEEQVVHTGTSLSAYEQENHIDGRDFWYLTSKVPWINESKEIIGIIGIGRDITEQKISQIKVLELNKDLEKRVAERTSALQEALSQLEDKHRTLKEAQAHLIQSEKMSSLGLLVAGVAHEINNPVNYVHGSAKNLELSLHEFKDFLFDLIGEDAEEGGIQLFEEKFERFFASLNTIQEGSVRIKNIVSDLRMFSRNDSEENEPVCLVESIRSTLRLIGTTYQPTVEIELDFQDDPQVQCSLAQLNQVFMNIIVNACHSIINRKDRLKEGEGEGFQGKLIISTRLRSPYLAICFKDNGCGMSEEVQNKIFEPFFTTKPVGIGTGMGLSISFGIIERHQGKIEVESKLNEGSAITILLPYYSQETS